MNFDQHVKVGEAVWPFVVRSTAGGGLRVVGPVRMSTRWKAVSDTTSDQRHSVTIIEQ